MKFTDVTVRFGSFTAVDSVSLEVPPGGIVGLVGESGSGKSSLAKAVSGLVRYSGQITGASRVQMVFQDPYASLDPRMKVGESVAEGLLELPRAARPDEVTRLLGLVSLPADLASRYPRELSGGMRQRVAIARAL
ncbi:ATP-binding cassette domain-containing protein, partial [Nonomuraea sp. NPDC055795]